MKMRIGINERKLFTLILFFITLTAVAERPVYCDRSDALSAYENADDSIKLAVKTLLKLDNEELELGLNDRINDAIGNLDASWVSLENMDYERSIEYSHTAQSIAIEVLADASSLVNRDAGLLKVLDSKITSMLIEAFTLSLVTYVALRRLNAFYVDKMLKETPEANTFES